MHCAQRTGPQGPTGRAGQSDATPRPERRRPDALAWLAEWRLFMVVVMIVVTALPAIAWSQPAASTLSSPAARDEPSAGPVVSPATGGLRLRELLDAALSSHPALLAARLQARAAGQEVEVVERQRWPQFSAVVESDAGHSSSAPSRAIRIDQTLWDAGQVSSRVAEATTRTAVAQAQVRQQQEELFIQVVNAWQTLVGAVERQRVAGSTLARLKGLHDQMQRRVQAQASPSIDLELADARVRQTEVELLAATTTVREALHRLEQMTSLSGLAVRLAGLPPLPPPQDAQAFLSSFHDTDLQGAADQHPNVLRARLDRQLVADQLQTRRAQQYPEVYARWSRPVAGTSLTGTKPSLFIGLRYTPGAGFSGPLEIEAMATRLQGSEQTMDAARRDALQVLRNEREELISASQRIGPMQRAVQGSQQVLDSYLRQFQAGRKSWLDLLNSARELAQAEYSLADAQATLAGSLHRMQLRLGRSPEAR